MVTKIESTELDFEAIRTKLKTHLAAQSEFADYDFEGSALANILDVLAYNTHYNALTANQAINESFLETAQLRGSVVSHAHSIGYYPRSRTTANATVNVSADLNAYIGDIPSTVTLPSGTTFAASVEGVTYTFQTREAFTATNDGDNVFTFVDGDGSSELKIYEGEDQTKTFYVPNTTDVRQFVINDQNIDQDTMSVKVFANANTSSFDSYTNIRNAVRITTTSKYYLFRETPNGNFEIQFTELGSLGEYPTAGNKIEVNYLRTNGKLANGARTFSASQSVLVNGQSFALTTATSANSSAGADKESIESIRFHAPLVYTTQRRMVTAEDYHTLIQSNYPGLSDVTAWGGELNIPVSYGKMYISIKYPDDTTEDSKLATEDAIATDLIEPLGTTSLTPKFIDPVISYVSMSVDYEFNPTLTGVTSQAMSERVNTAISTYFTDNLGIFGGEFRRSNLLTIIDEISPAILSSKMDVKINQRLTPTLTLDAAYSVAFPVALASPDDENYIITSSRFIYNGKTCTFRNKLSSNTIEMVDINNTVIIDSIGTYDIVTGTVNLTSFAPTSIIGGNAYVKVFATPANQATLTPLRNYILSLDAEETGVVPIINYQTTRVSL